MKGKRKYPKRGNVQRQTKKHVQKKLNDESELSKMY